LVVLDADDVGRSTGRVEGAVDEERAEENGEQDQCGQ
jgi:hypothetical protein